MDHKLKWPDRLFGKQLLKCDSLINATDFENVGTTDVLKSVEIVGVYFSFANINLQSDDFIKKLRDLYDRLNNGDELLNGVKKLEVIQVVMWANNDVYSDFETSHHNSLVGLPWFAMPFSEIDLKVCCSANIRTLDPFIKCEIFTSCR